MEKKKAAELFRKLCAELEDHNGGAFAAYQDSDKMWRITAANGIYRVNVYCAAMLCYVAQFLEACLGRDTISFVSPYTLCYVGGEVPENAQNDLDIREELFAALPRLCEEPPMFMYYDDMDTILTQSDDAATAIADFFASMGYDTPSGFFNPIEDAQHGTVNLCTGLYYVQFT